MNRLKTADVMRRLGIRSHETLRQMIIKKKIPQPLRDCENGPRYWLDSDIDGYIQGQAAARVDAGQPTQMAA